MQPGERFQTRSGKGNKTIVLKIWKLKIIGLILPDFLKNKWLNNIACEKYILVFVLSMENVWITLTDACLLHWKIRTSSALEMIKNVLIIFCWKIPVIKTEIASIETCWKLLGFPKIFLHGFLQSPGFPDGSGMKAVIPGYLCITDNLGTRHISAFL